MKRTLLAALTLAIAGTTGAGIAASHDAKGAGVKLNNKIVKLDKEAGVKLNNIVITPNGVKLG